MADYLLFFTIQLEYWTLMTLFSNIPLILFMILTDTSGREVPYSCRPGSTQVLQQLAWIETTLLASMYRYYSLVLIISILLLESSS